MSNSKQIMWSVIASGDGQRLDHYIAQLQPDYSRENLKASIKNSDVQINSMVITKPRTSVQTGQCITLNLPELPPHNDHWQAQDMPLDIIYADDHLYIINKPAGLVVHPGAGNPACTLVNALLHLDPHLEKLPRAGLIHRLDKDTSGLLVIARTLEAHTHLVRLLQARDITREYEAIVYGTMISGGTVDKAMGRHPKQRLRMAILPQGGKAAVTHYRVKQRFPAHTHIKVLLETGRTHQIRVHMQSIGHPIVGDPLYQGTRGRLALPKGMSNTLRQACCDFPRQALHAKRLAFKHPMTQQELSWEAPTPQDMQDLLALLQLEANSED